MDLKLARIRLFLFCSILFFLITSIYLIYLSIYNVNEEQKGLEDHSNTNIDVGEFRLEKDVYYLFGVTITFVFLCGILAVYMKSVCLLLFYSTTGCGMFILLLLILYVESVIPISVLLVLTVANISNALLAAYYAFYDQDDMEYKLMDKPYAINLI